MSLSDAKGWPIAVFDWGTTNLRVHVVKEDGSILATQSHSAGVKALQPESFSATFDFIFSELKQRFKCKAALLVGMVGSNLGWRQVAMQPAPASLQSLVRHLAPIESAPAWIIPGVAENSQARLPDMMRGEETQVFGANAILKRSDAFLCLPGTHTKWVRCEKHEITGISTAMTGELFDLLRRKSVLKGHFDGASGVRDMVSFDEGVAVSQDGAGLAQLAFSTRPRAILNRNADPNNALSYLSGAVIGSEIRSMTGRQSIGSLILVGDTELTGLYARAAGHYGLETQTIEGGCAVAKGAALIWAAAQAG